MRRHQLNVHLLKSHNEGTWLTCNVCAKKFSHSGSLKQHLLRHKNTESYVCDQCAKGFCTVQELKHHQAAHTGFKQFCCGLCGKNFKEKYNVLKHFERCSINRDSAMYNVQCNITV